MTAKHLLEDGRLGAAIDRLTADLKDRPDDAEGRIFLFELLGFAGQWDRASKHLDVLGATVADPQAAVGAGLYARLLESERQRSRLFKEGVRPRFALEPTEEVLLHLQAVEALRQGRPEEARSALDQAAERHRPSPGRSPSAPFDDIRDADDLLGPVLEVFAPAGYCWVPWQHVQFLEVSTPTRLRDLIWLPARLATFDGQLGEVHLPNLYHASSSSEDELIRLGRRTDWEELPGGIVRGLGQKVFLVGEADRTLAELAELHFDPPPELSPDGPAS
ncbi:type VI secretion system accessory protein TagJ [Tautonia plasticadhaerens]|uniref:ImpE protein n=1 Tax=Tautonia plasticadhaerens TaxID=2527974 RepID=A0A518GW07_9BACT|nr:type VI secretion system accessory protein TagJ [Tautonia plasticadhaerens]QDV32774.1 ImpE protein [Tautonia plasticadhaerens]